MLMRATSIASNSDKYLLDRDELAPAKIDFPGKRERKKNDSVRVNIAYDVTL